MKIDKLDKLFKYQQVLQDRLDVTKKLKAGGRPALQQYINQMILALHEETVEIMRESAYKNPDYVLFGWKKGQVFNKENFKNEIIDLMHFVINLCLAAGMSSQEFFDKYVEKNKINHERQDHGY